MDKHTAYNLLQNLAQQIGRKVDDGSIGADEVEQILASGRDIAMQTGLDPYEIDVWLQRAQSGFSGESVPGIGTSLEASKAAYERSELPTSGVTYNQFIAARGSTITDGMVSDPATPLDWMRGDNSSLLQNTLKFGATFASMVGMGFGLQSLLTAGAAAAGGSSIAATAGEFALDTAAKSFISPALETVAESFVAPVLETAAESFVAPVLETAAESFVAPVLETAAESFIAPALETAAESLVAPALETAAESFVVPVEFSTLETVAEFNTLPLDMGADFMSTIGETVEASNVDDWVYDLVEGSTDGGWSDDWSNTWDQLPEDVIEAPTVTETPSLPTQGTQPTMPNPGTPAEVFKPSQSGMPGSGFDVPIDRILSQGASLIRTILNPSTSGTRTDPRTGRPIPAGAAIDPRTGLPVLDARGNFVRATAAGVGGISPVMLGVGALAVYVLTRKKRN